VFLRDVAHDLLFHLAILEDQQRGDAAHAIPHRGGRVAVDIHFANLHLALILGRQFIDDRRDRAAWTAPGRPEIDEHRLVGFQNVGVEVRIGYFDDHIACHCSSQIPRSGPGFELAGRGTGNKCCHFPWLRNSNTPIRCGIPVMGAEG
jgi:hypothetical protein